MIIWLLCLYSLYGEARQWCIMDNTYKYCKELRFLKRFPDTLVKLLCLRLLQSVYINSWISICAGSVCNAIIKIFFTLRQNLPYLTTYSFLSCFTSWIYILFCWRCKPNHPPPACSRLNVYVFVLFAEYLFPFLVRGSRWWLEGGG